MAWTPLKCPKCDETRTTGRGLFWHIMSEHLDAEERALQSAPEYVYDLVGQAIDRASCEIEYP